MEKKKIILTYGTFDIYHEGHRNVIKNSKMEGDLLFVGIASDQYVENKNKISLLDYESRKILLDSDPLVDFTFPEHSLSQWSNDFLKYEANKIMISEEHKYEILSHEELSELDIQYFSRTPGISTSKIKKDLESSKVVLTYGTFDLLHHGHNNIFKKSKELGDILIVAVSTDEFNNLKGKNSMEDFSTRLANVKNNPYVDYVIPEISWDQKSRDVIKFNVNTLTMGSDWDGKFDELEELGIVVKIIERTQNISSTEIRRQIEKFKKG